MATIKTTPVKKPDVPVTIGVAWGHKAPTPYRTRLSDVKRVVNDNILCGVELEIESTGNSAGYYHDHVTEFWNVTEDGSLRPRGESWEFVSRPATIGVALTEMEYFFQKFKFTDERNYSDRTSVHVHTNVQDWTYEQLAGLSLIYPVFESVLFQYVNHYKKREEQGYCRDTNLYCIPWSDCRHNRNFVQKFLNQASIIRNWQKYTALNFLPIQDKGTVEWRHMHGTADMEKLTTWFNIIGAIMQYCKNTSFDEVVKTIKVLNDVSTYQQFFSAVLLDTLPYDETYRRLMAEGVVNAKYSLINWEADKDQPKKDKKTVSTLGGRAGEWGFLDDVGAGDVRVVDNFVQMAAQNPLNAGTAGIRWNTDAQFVQAIRPGQPPARDIPRPDLGQQIQQAQAERIRQEMDRMDQARAELRDRLQQARRPAPAPRGTRG